MLWSNNKGNAGNKYCFGVIIGVMLETSKETGEKLNNEPPSWENLSSGFATRSDSNRSMGSSLKYRIWEEERSYYLCSENKGADQADLRLCFHICKNRFSHDAAVFINDISNK